MIIPPIKPNHMEAIDCEIKNRDGDTIIRHGSVYTTAVQGKIRFSSCWLLDPNQDLLHM